MNVGEERRRAGFRQPPCHQGPALGVTVGEIDAVVAVDLQVHQARHEHAGAQIQVGVPPAAGPAPTSVMRPPWSAEVAGLQHGGARQAGDDPSRGDKH